jgi:transketolase
MRTAFINTLIDLAAKDERIFLLSGDLGFSVLEKYMEKYPDRYLNCGVAEQNMIGMACGLTLKNRKVFVYSIIPFITYRVMEQIRNDLCYQRVPVKIIGVGTGVTYGSAGGTHHAIEDIGVMTSIPDIFVFSPGDALEVEKIIEESVKLELPCYIRLNKAGDPIVNTGNSIKNFKIGEPLKVYGTGYDVVIFAVGNMLPLGLEVIKDLEKGNIAGCLYSAHTLKPINENSISKILAKGTLIVTLEEHISRNGFSSVTSSILVKEGLSKVFLPFSLPDKFIHDVGSQNFLRTKYGLSKENILMKIKQHI